jgi:hypothetical protein
VSPRVVDKLELVEVSEENRDRVRATTLEATERLLKTISQQTAVCQTRQVIVQSPMAQLILEPSSLRDIGNHR